MASLRRLLNSPNWIACFTLPDGRRTQRSTGTHDRRAAQRIANSFEDASQEGKRGRFTEFQARKVIADIYAISNRDQLASSTIKDFFESWLKRKEIEATQKTHERYKTAMNHLLGFLGAKARQDITHLSGKEITLFRDALAEKLSGASVNTTLKILRTALGQAMRWTPTFRPRTAENMMDSCDLLSLLFVFDYSSFRASKPFGKERTSRAWHRPSFLSLFLGFPTLPPTAA